MRTDRGTTLVEAIIAIGILAGAVVALAGLSSVAMRQAAIARERSVATVLALQKLEALVPRRLVDRGISRQRLVGRHARLSGIPGCLRKRDSAAALAARTSADGRSRRCRRTRTSWPSRLTWRRAARMPGATQCGDVVARVAPCQRPVEGRMVGLRRCARFHARRVARGHGRHPRRPRPCRESPASGVRGVSTRCPEAVDAQQRLRVAAQTLADDIMAAGAGPVSGWGGRAIPAWPAVLPCRWAGEPLGTRPGGCASDDAHQHRGDAPRRAAGHRRRGPGGSRRRHSRCAPLGLRALPPRLPLSRRCPRACGRRLRGMGRRPD